MLPFEQQVGHGPELATRAGGPRPQGGAQRALVTG